MPMSPAERQAKLDNWIADLEAKGKLTAEALASVKSAIATPEAMEYIVGSQLRQQESDKWYQESQKLQKDLTSKITELNDWHSKAQTSVNEANATAKQTAESKAQIERMYLEARTKLASTYDVTPEVLDQILPPTGVYAPQNANPNNPGFQPPPTSTNGKPELSGQKPDYITRNDLLSGALDILKLQDQRIQLAQRHKQLFGEELTDFTGLVVEADTNQMKLEDAWSAKYGVANKEAEIRKAEFDSAVKKAYEDGKMQGLTERSLPTSAGNGNTFGRPSLGSMLQDKLPEGARSNEAEILRNSVIDFRQRQELAISKLSSDA